MYYLETFYLWMYALIRYLSASRGRANLVN